MKRLMIFLFTTTLATLLQSGVAVGLTPDQYALQVIQRDLPQVVRWFGEVGAAPSKTQAEVYSIYQSALPEPQKNHHLGISIKGSVERMLLLLEGARYFEQVQKGSIDFQNKKEITMRILQGAKDHLDRTQFGDDPQVLLEEWVGAVVGMSDPAKFSNDVIEVFTELQRLLAEPVLTSFNEVAGVDQSFELQRFSSYLQSVESGNVAAECQTANLWKTDRAESCSQDDPIECDRNYARTCKKLQ